MKTEIDREIRAFIITNFYVPDAASLADDASLLDLGIVDSTGVLELVGFLEDRYGIKVDDQELVPENLDSIVRIANFVSHKSSAQNLPPTPPGVAPAGPLGYGKTMRAVKRAAFGLLVVAFAGAAAFHAAALASPGLDPSAPPLRHAAFVAINLACALGFARRPAWFLAPFALLVAQQLVSHGGAALGAFREGRVDVASIAVVAVMPLALALLASAARERRRARQGGA